MYKRVPIQTKNEILEKVKQGVKVADIANQYAISVKNIYLWIRNDTRPESYHYLNTKKTQMRLKKPMIT